MKKQAYCNYCGKRYPIDQMVTFDHIGLSVTRLCGMDAIAMVNSISRQLDAKGLR